MGKIRLLYLVVCSCLFKYCFKTSLFALILFLLKARYNGMDSLIELIRIYLINVHSKIQKPLMIIPCWAKEVFDIPAQTINSWFRWIGSELLSYFKSSNEDHLDFLFWFDNHALENLPDDLIVIADRVIRQRLEDYEDFVESGFCVFALLCAKIMILSWTTYKREVILFTKL